MLLIYVLTSATSYYVLSQLYSRRYFLKCFLFHIDVMSV